jgi:hypothetical protein
MTEEDEMDEFLETVGEEYTPDNNLPNLLRRLRATLEAQNEIVHEHVRT